MGEIFCLWHDRKLSEVAEWQQNNCEENGMHCNECQFLKNERERQEKTVQWFMEQGKCEECYFYGVVDVAQGKEPMKGCTFHWFDSSSEDWEMERNCK